MQCQAPLEDGGADEIEPPSLTKQQSPAVNGRSDKVLGGPLRLIPVANQADRHLDETAGLPDETGLGPHSIADVEFNAASGKPACQRRLC